AGSECLRGQVEVVRRRRWIARWMVMDEDDPRGVEPNRIAIELAHPNEARADVALVDGRNAEHGVLRVEQDDPQLLALEATHLQNQPLSHIARRPDRPAARPP